MNDSKAILQLVLDNIPQGVFWKNRDSVYLGCNRVVWQTLGLAGPEELIGKSDFQFPSLTHEQAEGFVRADRQVMESGLSQSAIIEPLTRFDGNTIWLETIKVPLRDSEGAIIGVLGTWQDVTHRRNAEEAIHRSEQRHRSLVLAMSEMVWTSNARGSQLRVVPPLELFTGMPRELIKGSGWLQAVHPDDRSRTATAWTTAVANRSHYNCEFQLRRADGEWRVIQSRGIPLQDQAGQVLEWVGVGIDITEQRRAEMRIQQLNSQLEQRVAERTRELESANKELEAFSYSVSHDLRAPLRAIDGFSRILLAEFASQLSDEAQEYLKDIRTNTRMMGQLVDDLLAFSRLGRSPLKRQNVSSDEVVKRCVSELLDPLDGPTIHLRIGRLPDCRADPSLLKQVWMNLISNAIKYSSKREVPDIEIGSLAGDGSEELTYFIQDNGVGFDMKYSHKLFGVFQRLHRSEEFEGTGVGLATVQRIVHRHGGRAWGKGVVDQGACFYFTLPRQGAEP